MHDAAGGNEARPSPSTFTQRWFECMWAGRDDAGSPRRRSRVVLRADYAEEFNAGTRKQENAESKQNFGRAGGFGLLQKHAGNRPRPPLPQCVCARTPPPGRLVPAQRRRRRSRARPTRAYT
eukprot:6174023-Pleurochrysis_carterae.AAC.9